MPVVVPATEPANDDFASAFDSLTALEGKSGAVGVVPDEAASVAAEPVAAVDVDPAVADSAVVANPAVTVGAVAGTTPAVDHIEPDGGSATPKQPVVEPAKPVDTSNDDMLRRLAALVKEPAPTPVAQPQATPPPKLFTIEEETLLATYKKEWPEIERAETLRLRAAQVEVVDHMNRQFAQVLEPLMARVQELEPLMATVQELSSRTQLGDLQTAVPDYTDVRDKTIAWARSQPAYLQSAYEHVIKEGTAEEVRHLIAQFKQATGYVQPPAAATTPAVTQNELPAATKKAAAALAPVRSLRSTPVANGVDPTNFDAGFAAAAAFEAAAEAAQRSR